MIALSNLHLRRDTAGENMDFLCSGRFHDVVQGCSVEPWSDLLENH